MTGLTAGERAEMQAHLRMVEALLREWEEGVRAGRKPVPTAEQIRAALDLGSALMRFASGGDDA